MAYLKQRVDQRLLAVQLAVENTLKDQDVLTELTLFGYDEAKLNVGKRLYEEAQALVNQQKVEYGEQYQATQVLHQAKEKADKVYTRTLKIARIALRGNVQAHTALILGGPRKRSLAGWLAQAQAFYANLRADADLIAQMANFGYDQAKLEAEQALVLAVLQADQTQQKEMGEARQATKLRDAKLDEMDEWMLDFITIVRVALEEEPEKLATLGISS